MNSTISIFQYQKAFAEYLTNGGKETDRVRQMSNGNLIVFRDGAVAAELPIVRQVNIKDTAGLITKVRFLEEEGASNTTVYGVVNGRECFILDYDSTYAYEYDDFIGKTITDVFTTHAECEAIAHNVSRETHGVIERVVISMVNASTGLHGTVLSIMENGQELEILHYENVGEYAYNVEHFIGKTKEQAISMHKRNEILVALRIQQRSL